VIDGLGDALKVTLHAAGKPPSNTSNKPSPPPAHVAERRSRFDPSSAAPDTDTPILLCVIKESAAEAQVVLATLLAATPWRGERPAPQVLDETT